jgi:hypothetical protein
MPRTLFFLALCITAFPPTARAAGSDTGLWAIATVKHGLNEKWTGSLSSQLRFHRDIGSLERVVLRPSLDYRVSRRFTATAGYDAHFIRSPADKIEQRTWQQLLYRMPAGGFKLSGRLRLEQRFIEHVDGTAVRLRIYAKATRALAKGPWYVALRNEVAFGLNNLQGGPRDGFDQNRLFVGLGRSLSPGSGFEVGYQMHYARRTGEDVIIHQVFINVLFQ